MPQRVDRDRLDALVEAGAQVVEVLPPNEYGSGHLPGALSIPYKQFEGATIAELDRQRPVVVYCSGFL